MILILLVLVKYMSLNLQLYKAFWNWNVYKIGPSYLDLKQEPELFPDDIKLKNLCIYGCMNTGN